MEEQQKTHSYNLRSGNIDWNNREEMNQLLVDNLAQSEIQLPTNPIDYHLEDLPDLPESSISDESVVGEQDNVFRIVEQPMLVENSLTKLTSDTDSTVDGPTVQYSTTHPVGYINQPTTSTHQPTMTQTMDMGILQHILKAIEVQGNDLKQGMSQQSTTINERLTQQSMTINERLDQQSAEISKQSTEIRLQGTTLNERLDQQSAEIRQQGAEMRQQGLAMEEKLQQQTKRIEAQQEKFIINLRQEIQKEMKAEIRQLKIEQEKHVSSLMTGCEQRLHSKLCEVETAQSVRIDQINSLQNMQGQQINRITESCIEMQNKQAEQLTVVQREVNKIHDRTEQLQSEVTELKTSQNNSLPREILVTCANHGDETDISLPKFYPDNTNPKVYLERLEKYLKQYFEKRPKTSITYKDLLESSLQGNATQWFQLVKDDIENYTNFRERFVNKYWNAQIQNHVRRTVETNVWRANRKVTRAEYLTNKAFLLKSLEPRVDEANMVEILSFHFGDDVANTIRLMNISTLEDMEMLLTRLDLADKFRNNNYPSPGTIYRPNKEPAEVRGGGATRETEANDDPAAITFPRQRRQWTHPTHEQRYEGDRRGERNVTAYDRPWPRNTLPQRSNEPARHPLPASHTQRTDFRDYGNRRTQPYHREAHQADFRRHYTGPRTSSLRHSSRTYHGRGETEHSGTYNYPTPEQRRVCETILPKEERNHRESPTKRHDEPLN